MRARVQGRVETTIITSKKLKGNPLGDPHERELLVYLPPGYDDGARFPIVMLLPGFGSNHRSFLRYDIWEPNVVELFDRLVVSGACAPALLVLPDAITRWGGSQFIDSPATGDYQTYLADEVIAEVDSRYRTVPQREARAVIGRSSGGFGALRMGLDRPDVFSVVGSHAGDAAFEVSLRPLFHKAAIAFNRAGGVRQFAEALSTRGPKGSEHDALFMLAVATAYAPNLDAESPMADLPFHLDTLCLREEVWQRYLAQDPLKLIDERKEAVRSLSMIFIDAGQHDEYALQFAARQLEAKLNEVGAPVHYDEFDGGHRGTSYRYETSLPAIIAALRDN